MRGEAAPENARDVGGRAQHVDEALGLLALPVRPHQQELAAWRRRSRAQLVDDRREQVRDLDRPIVPLGRLGRRLHHDALAGEVGEADAVDGVVVRGDDLALGRRHVVVEIAHDVLWRAGEQAQRRARTTLHHLPGAGAPERVHRRIAPVVGDLGQGLDIGLVGELGAHAAGIGEGRMGGVELAGDIGRGVVRHGGAPSGAQRLCDPWGPRSRANPEAGRRFLRGVRGARRGFSQSSEKLRNRRPSIGSAWIG